MDLKNANSNGNFKHAISWALPHVNYLKKNKNNDLGHFCISKYRARYSPHGIFIESLIFWNDSFYRWQEQLHHQKTIDLIAFLHKVPSINLGKKANITECLLRKFEIFAYRKVHFIQFGWSFFSFVTKYFIKCFSALRVLSSKNSFTFLLAVFFNFIFAFLQSFLCFSVYF